MIEEHIPWEHLLAMASFWSKEANPFLSNGENTTFFAIWGVPEEEEPEAIFLKLEFEP